MKNEKPCKILVLGLTYKVNIDDLRESPALHIARTLGSLKNLELLVCEPNVSEDEINRIIDARPVEFHEGLEEADIILALVAHDQFKSLPSIALKGKKVFDYCGICHVERYAESNKEQLFWPASLQEYEVYSSPGIFKEEKFEKDRV